jgi:hypothetical protein
VITKGEDTGRVGKVDSTAFCSMLS